MEPGGAAAIGWQARLGGRNRASDAQPQLNGQDKTKLYLRNVFESLFARTADGGYVP